MANPRPKASQGFPLHFEYVQRPALAYETGPAHAPHLQSPLICFACCILSTP